MGLDALGGVPLLDDDDSSADILRVVTSLDTLDADVCFSLGSPGRGRPLKPRRGQHTLLQNTYTEKIPVVDDVSFLINAEAMDRDDLRHNPAHHTTPATVTHRT